MKLGKMDQRAKEACECVKKYSSREHPYRFAVIWKKSSTWGHCPSLYKLNGSEKLAYADGCGYDKLSAVLASGLRFLGETDEECRKIHGLGGTGERNFVSELAELGWAIEITSGRTEDHVSVRRIAKAAAKMWLRWAEAERQSL